VNWTVAACDAAAANIREGAMTSAPIAAVFFIPLTPARFF
jgi:hypothetical protein